MGQFPEKGVLLSALGAWSKEWRRVRVTALELVLQGSGDEGAGDDCAAAGISAAQAYSARNRRAVSALRSGGLPLEPFAGPHDGTSLITLYVFGHQFGADKVGTILTPRGIFAVTESALLLKLRTPASTVSGAKV